MEKMQLTIFNQEDEVEVEESKEEITIKLGDKVKIVLPEDKDSELFTYLHYYYPHVINKVGEIIDIQVSSKGIRSLTINVKNDILILNESDVVLLI